MEHTPNYPRSMSKEAQTLCKGLMTRSPKNRLGAGSNGKRELKCKK